MLVSALLIASLPVSQSAISDIARAEQARLNACIELTDTDPNAAYEDSLVWLTAGNRPKARYCNAISLLALENFEEGAARLEALATAPDPISVEDRALYMAQAGNAWLTANYPEAAITALSEALRLQKNDPDIFKDRAAAYLALERWDEGILDLNAALDMVPVDAEALALRARAHLAQDALNLAKADMESALAQDPVNIDILVLRGDIREAIRLSQIR